MKKKKKKEFHKHKTEKDRWFLQLHSSQLSHPSGTDENNRNSSYRSDVNRRSPYQGQSCSFERS